MPSDRPPRADARRTRATSRRPYRAPQLRVFGSVAQMTQAGVVSPMSDHGSNGMFPS